MRTNENSAASLRAIIRWTTGAVVSISITAGACVLFPLLSSLPALALTVCLSLFIGLNIALPPLDPEDDWVPIHAHEEQAVKNDPVRSQSAETSKFYPSNRAAMSGIEALPGHRRRSTGAPSGTWSVYHPELKWNDEAHRITLSDRKRHNIKPSDKAHSPSQTRK